MKIRQKGIVTALVLSLLPLPMNDLVALAEARAQGDSFLVNERVALLGVGAKVVVQVAGTERSSRGTIEAIEGEAFVLATERDVSPQRIRYDQVVRLEPVKRSYKAVAQPDPIEVRRAVVGLGPGRLVKVKLTDGRQITGRIRAVMEDYFYVISGQSVMATRIAYTDVQQVKGKGSTSKVRKIVEWGVVVPVLLVVVLVLAGLSHAAEQATK